MTAVLYVEGSLCLQTGASGWGALLQADTAYGSGTFSGCLSGSFGRSITMMELEAAQKAVATVVARGLARSALTLSMRSTAALAVLRWVFPDAPFDGSILVQKPKRLGIGTRDYQPLYDLHDQVERIGMRLSLRYTALADIPMDVHAFARSEMESQRPVARRAVAR